MSFARLNSSLCFIRGSTLAGLLEAWRYPLDQVRRWAYLALKLYGLYVATHLFHGTYDALWRIGDFDYFTFVLTGVIVLVPCQAALAEIPSEIYHLVLSGRLATMWSLPHPRWLLICGSSVWRLIAKWVLATVTLVVLVGVCLPDGAPVSGATSALALTLCSLTYFFMSIAGSAVLMVVRRGDVLLSLLGLATSYCAGSFVAVESLPRWAQVVAQFLPLTHSLRAIRAELRGGADTMLALLILLGMCVFWAVAARTVMRRCGRYLVASGALTKW